MDSISEALVKVMESKVALECQLNAVDTLFRLHSLTQGNSKLSDSSNTILKASMESLQFIDSICAMEGFGGKTTELISAIIKGIMYILGKLRDAVMFVVNKLVAADTYVKNSLKSYADKISKSKVSDEDQVVTFTDTQIETLNYINAGFYLHNRLYNDRLFLTGDELRSATMYLSIISNTLKRMAVEVTEIKDFIIESLEGVGEKIKNHRGELNLENDVELYRFALNNRISGLRQTIQNTLSTHKDRNDIYEGKKMLNPYTTGIETFVFKELVGIFRHSVLRNPPSVSFYPKETGIHTVLFVSGEEVYSSRLVSTTVTDKNLKLNSGASIDVPKTSVLNIIAELEKEMDATMHSSEIRDALDVKEIGKRYKDQTGYIERMHGLLTKSLAENPLTFGIGTLSDGEINDAETKVNMAIKDFVSVSLNCIVGMEKTQQEFALNASIYYAKVKRAYAICLEYINESLKA